MDVDERKILIATTFKTSFDEVGYKKTTVEGVAKKLEMSKKTIYKYFSSKEDAFKFLVSRYARFHVENMKKQISNIGDEWGKLEFINKMCFDKVYEAILKAEKDEFSFFYPDRIPVKAFQSAYREMVKDILITGMQKGVFKIPDLSLYMIFIEAIIANGMEHIKTNTNNKIADITYNAILKLLK